MGTPPSYPTTHLSLLFSTPARRDSRLCSGGLVTAQQIQVRASERARRWQCIAHLLDATLMHHVLQQQSAAKSGAWLDSHPRVALSRMEASITCTVCRAGALEPIAAVRGLSSALPPSPLLAFRAALCSRPPLHISYTIAAPCQPASDHSPRPSSPTRLTFRTLDHCRC